MNKGFLFFLSPSPSPSLSLSLSLNADSYLGQVNVKIGKIGDEVVNVHPEYEDCKALALSANVPLRDVFRLAETEYRQRNI